jgi:hypothetical protein
MDIFSGLCSLDRVRVHPTEPLTGMHGLLPASLLLIDSSFAKYYSLICYEKKILFVR